MCTGIPCEGRWGVVRLKEGVVGVSEVQQCLTEEFTQRKKLVRHINWGAHLPSSRAEILG